jgi:hypothetical protein
MTLTFENVSLGGMRGQLGVNSRDDVAASFTPPTAGESLGGERLSPTMSGASGARSSPAWSGARSSPRLSPRVNVTPPWELKSQLAELRRMQEEIEVADVGSSSALSVLLPSPALSRREGALGGGIAWNIPQHPRAAPRTHDQDVPPSISAYSERDSLRLSPTSQSQVVGTYTYTHT